MRKIVLLWQTRKKTSSQHTSDGAVARLFVSGPQEQPGPLLHETIHWALAMNVWHMHIVARGEVGPTSTEGLAWPPLPTQQGRWLQPKGESSIGGGGVIGGGESSIGGGGLLAEDPAGIVEPRNQPPPPARGSGRGRRSCAASSLRAADRLLRTLKARRKNGTQCSRGASNHHDSK